jgi:hypothetical protein
VLPRLCGLSLLAACAPFLATLCPWMTRASHLVLATASLVIVSTGIVAVLLARSSVEAAAKSSSVAAGQSKCAVCGSDAGVILCLGCGSLQPSAQEVSAAVRPLRMAALIVHRWPALLAFLAAVYLPGAYSVLNEAVRAQEERLQRQREAAQAFATAWSDFRGPLIAFGVTCGPTATLRSEACDELVRQIATNYTRMSWYMPSILADLRTHACADVPPLQDGRPRLASTAACQSLVRLGERHAEPTGPSGNAFKTFMNAYAHYRDEATPPARGSAIEALGGAAALFYWETRKLGCSLMFANLTSVEDKHQQDLSRFCSAYLLDHAQKDPEWIGDEQWLDWGKWFKDVPSPPSQAVVAQVPRESVSATGRLSKKNGSSASATAPSHVTQETADVPLEARLPAPQLAP